MTAEKSETSAMRAQRFVGACLIGILALCGVGSEGAAQQVIRAYVADGLELEMKIIRLEDVRPEGEPQTIEESLLRFAAGGEPRYAAKGNLAELHALYPDAPPYDEVAVLNKFLVSKRAFALEWWPPPCAGGAGYCIQTKPAVHLLTSLRLDGSEAPILVTGEASVISRLDSKGSDLPQRVWSYSEPISETRWTGLWDQAPGGPILFLASTEPPNRKLDPEERRTALQVLEAQLVNLAEP